MTGLFEGDCNNGLRLCMGLTGGDFWSRVNGCDNLYRRDLSNPERNGDIVGCSQQGCGQISAASFVRHRPGGYYVYILRSCSRCGDELFTDAPSAAVQADSSGNIETFDSNAIANVSARQVGEGVVRLVWYYSGAGIKDEPVSFSVYAWAKGQAYSFDEPIGEAGYKGVRVYGFEAPLEGGSGYVLAAAGMSQSGERICVGFCSIDLSDAPAAVSPEVLAADS